MRKRWNVILALGSHLISSIGFEEEVTHTKRAWERQRESIVHFQEKFLREREQEKTRKKPLQNFEKSELQAEYQDWGHEFLDKVHSWRAQVTRQIFLVAGRTSFRNIHFLMIMAFLAVLLTSFSRNVWVCWFEPYGFFINKNYDFFSWKKKQW